MSNVLVTIIGTLASATGFSVTIVNDMTDDNVSNY